MKHIIFNPSNNPENQYISLLVNGIRRHRFYVHDLNSIFASWDHFKKIELVHLNWFENIDDSSSKKGLISYFRKMLVLRIIRLSGKKLVWTMHNRESHEKKTGKMANKITKLLVKWSDAIVIHSKMSRDLLLENHAISPDKIHHIPHPNFIGVYGSPLPKTSPISPSLKLLFVGAVKPYKNIELLIKTVGEIQGNVELLIAGKARDKAYAEHLIELAKPYPWITLRLQFIPDGLLPELIGKSDALVLPYDLGSSLNSGTVILAFSYKKTVICPNIGTLCDMEEVEEQFFGYSYQSPEEHEAVLKESILKAAALKNAQPEAIYAMGLRMQEYIDHTHGQQEAANKLVNLYQGLLQN